MNLFNKKPEVVYQIIEVEKSTKLPELTGDLRESLKTLQFSPAFNYILMRLRLQKASAEAALRGSIDAGEPQLRYLQAAIYWLGNIERDINLLTQTSASTPRPAFDNEAAEFKRIQESIELLD